VDELTRARRVKEFSLRKPSQSIRDTGGMVATTAHQVDLMVDMTVAGDLAPDKLREVVTTARNLARRIAELAGEGENEGGAREPSTAASVSRSQMYSSILVLKSAHRTICENLEGVRQHTQGVKAALDATSLKLENLRYQERHYQREIRACRVFTEEMEESLMGDGIELVSEEAYRKYIAEEMEKDRALAAAEDGEEGEEGEEGEDMGTNDGNDGVEALDDEGEEGEEDEDEEGQVANEEGQVEEGAASDKEEGEDTEMRDADAASGKRKGHKKASSMRLGVGADNHAHIFKLGRLHFEVERRQLALEELASLKAERDAVAADIAKRHTIVNEVVAEIDRLKMQVAKRLAGFEGAEFAGSGLNPKAQEFRLPG